MATVLQSMRSGCACKKSGLVINGETIEARQYDVDSTALARNYSMQESVLLGNGYITVLDGAIDGKKMERERLVFRVKSKASGGLSKRDCGFDPSVPERRYMSKVQDTTRMYIHTEICANQAIGTNLQQLVFKDGKFVDPNKNQNLLGSDKYVMGSMNAMSAALDGTIVLGIHKGSDERTHHFDGIIAQAVRQRNATYYETISYAFGSIGSDNLYTKVGGEEKVFSSYNALATYLQGLKDNKGNLLYTVIHANNSANFQITANTVGASVILEVVKAAAGLTIDWTKVDCDGYAYPKTQPTVIQNRMPFAQEPVEIPYVAITKDNFIEQMMLVQRRILETQDVEIDYTGRKLYMAIDPLVLQVAGVEAIMCNCNCFSQFKVPGSNELNQFIWEFVPLNTLKGTGLFYATYTDNVFFLTDTMSSQGTINIGVEEKCDTGWSKYEMLGNVVVGDFSEVYHNAIGSSFGTQVQNNDTPYLPENIPALCPAARQNCLSPVTTDVATFDLAVDETGAATFTDRTVAPAGLTISGRAWTFQFIDGSTASGGTSASGTASLGTGVAGVLKLVVTFSNGATDTAFQLFNVA